MTAGGCFTPSAAQTETGDLEVTSDDPDEGLVTVSLTGVGSSAPPATVIRINAGGPAYTATNGDLFEADLPYTPGGYGCLGPHPSPLGLTRGRCIRLWSRLRSLVYFPRVLFNACNRVSASFFFR